MHVFSKDEFEGQGLVVEIISLLLFVGIIYFGIKGALVLSLQTTSPMMGVSGDSMTQVDGSWKDYYIEGGFEPSAFPFQNGLHDGDLVIVRGVQSIEEVDIGDVIIWRRGGGEAIVHRVAVINREEGYIRTRSDRYGGLDRRVWIEDILGEAVYSIPYLGRLTF